MPLLAVDCQRITRAVNAKALECLGGKNSCAYNDKSLRSKTYADIYGEIRRQFNVTSYKAIKRSECDTVVDLVNRYVLPMVLKRDIDNSLAQLGLGV